MNSLLLRYQSFLGEPLLTHAIDRLIEKDYMERDEDAHNTYSYVA